MRSIVGLQAPQLFFFLVSDFNKLILLVFREYYTRRDNFNALAVTVSLQTCMKYRLAESRTYIQESRIFFQIVLLLREW